MPLVNVEGVRLNYVEQGMGDEMIVLAHGWSHASGVWREVLELLPKEYHAYALDHRGHGESEKPGGYDLAQFAGDIYAFSRKLGIEKFTYVGHSMGGPIGMRLALDHPEVLKALVLVAPSPAHGVELTPDAMAMMQSMGFTDVTTAVKSMFSSPEMTRFFMATMFATPPTEERLNELLDYSLAMDPKAVDGCWAWLMSPGLEPRLGEISVPTLIIAGVKDTISLDAIRRTANGIKGCRLEVFEDSGHVLHIENPKRFVDLLTRFIEDTGRQ